MAKFCTKCGKKLEEGKACDCEVTTEVVQTASQGFDIKECANAYLDIIKGIFTKPVNTIQKYVTEGNLVLGIIAILLNSIVNGLFVYCFCTKAVDLLSVFMGGYGSLLSMSGAVEVPFVSTVLYGAIYMLVMFVVTALMVYVIANPILKDNMNFKKAISLVGVCSVFTTITTIVAIVLLYVSVKLSMLVLVVAGMFYNVHLYQGIGETTKLDKNKLAYVFVAAIAVAMFATLYILPKILV